MLILDFNYVQVIIMKTSRNKGLEYIMLYIKW